MPQLPNQAHIEGLDEQNNKGEADVTLNAREIGMLHAVSDQPGAEFDIIIEDMAGNEQLKKLGCKNETNRWGERINLPITDSYYKIKVENVKGAKSLDIFLE